MWACRYVGMYVGSYGLRGHVTCGHVGMWVCTGMIIRNIGNGFFFFFLFSVSEKHGYAIFAVSRWGVCMSWRMGQQGIDREFKTPGKTM